MIADILMRLVRVVLLFFIWEWVANNDWQSAAQGTIVLIWSVLEQIVANQEQADQKETDNAV